MDRTILPRAGRRHVMSKTPKRDSLSSRYPGRDSWACEVPASKASGTTVNISNSQRNHIRLLFASWLAEDTDSISRAQLLVNALIGSLTLLDQPVIGNTCPETLKRRLAGALA